MVTGDSTGNSVRGGGGQDISGGGKQVVGAVGMDDVRPPLGTTLFHVR